MKYIYLVMEDVVEGIEIFQTPVSAFTHEVGMHDGKEGFLRELIYEIKRGVFDD